jgi:hypothetical protein
MINFFMADLQKKNSKAILRCALLFWVLTLFYGCSTKIPKTDTTVPIVRFTIIGPGVNLALNNQEEADNREVHLQVGQNYKISFVVIDEGGVSSNSVYISRESNMVLEPFTNQNGEILRDLPSTPVDGFPLGLSHVFHTAGNRRSPITSLIIKGGLRLENMQLGISLDITAEGADFGGMAGRSNYKTIRIQMLSAANGDVIVFKK